MSRILVAEDDPHILRVISMWLTRQGHEVLEARNGLAALDLYDSHAPEIVLTDVNMPGMDGLQLIEQIVTTRPQPRGTIVLTNRWDHAEIRERLGKWGVQVLPKPFSPSRLSTLVDALTEGTPLPSASAGGTAAPAEENV